MLGNRLWRCPNIEPPRVQCGAFTGMNNKRHHNAWQIYSHHNADPARPNNPAQRRRLVWERHLVNWRAWARWFVLHIGWWTPANTGIDQYVLMLGQRTWRWANTKATLGHCLLVSFSPRTWLGELFWCCPLADKHVNASVTVVHTFENNEIF